MCVRVCVCVVLIIFCSFQGNLVPLTVKRMTTMSGRHIFLLALAIGVSTRFFLNLLHMIVRLRVALSRTVLFTMPTDEFLAAILGPSVQPGHR